MMKLTMDVKFIEKNRERLGLSKTAFSHKIGYSHPSGYSNLLKRKYIPRSSVLDKLAQEIGCRPIKLFIVK
jgi:transcriptional regulator with XRE-family HTH domain